MWLYDSGPTHAGGRRNLRPLGRRRQDSFGEPLVVGLKIDCEARLRIVDIAAQAVGRIRQQHDSAIRCCSDHLVCRRAIGFPIRAVLKVIQPGGDPSGGDEQYCQHNWTPSDQAPAHPWLARAYSAATRRLHVRGSYHVADRGIVVDHHGNDSAFAIFNFPPSRWIVITTRHDRGGGLLLSGLATSALVATRTTAESSVIDSTATAFTATLVLTFESSTALTRSSSPSRTPVLKGPVLSSMMRCTPSLALLASIDISAVTPCRAAVANSSARCRSWVARRWYCST